MRTAMLEGETQIIGGKPAQEGEWPWQAAMLYNGRRICGGSLIHPRWILSAAHCVYVDKNVNKTSFFSGRGVVVEIRANVAPISSCKKNVLYPGFELDRSPSVHQWCMGGEQ